MRSSLDHLPAGKQRELEHIKSVLLREFEAAVSGGTQAWRRNGKILKLILFGSFSRTDWVDEPQNGYQSDWDILAIVSHENLTDIADYWFVAEDKLLRDPKVKRSVNVIVHTLAEVNEALTKGRYFWVDIIRDGVLLCEQPGSPLAAPMPPTAADAYQMAQTYFMARCADTEDWIRLAELATNEDQTSLRWRKKAAFNLHQAAETAYACFLLVETFYFPRSHNLKFLRSLAEDNDRRLVEAWPRESKLDRRRFELLKRAYVEARYSDAYEISAEDLAALSASVRKLQSVVADVCNERLSALKLAAEAG
ncbi:MAG: HEPN domain-containing protein [Pseudomonadota bacterium]|jgi:predicted nucleotidyltransferase/HEPN domain-containing protein